MGDVVKFPKSQHETPTEPSEPSFRCMEVVRVEDMKREIWFTAICSGVLGAGIAFLTEVFT